MTTELATRQQGRVIRREDAGGWLEGNTYLEKARSVLDEAQKETARIKEDAYQKGYREGQLAGMREVEHLINDTRAALKSFEQDLDRRVLDLALAISRKIVGTVEASDAIASGASEAIASFKENATLTLSVPPALHEAIRLKLKELLDARTSDTRNVTVQKDAALKPDQAYLSDGASSVDLSVSTQLLTVEKALRRDVAGELQ